MNLVSLFDGFGGAAAACAEAGISLTAHIAVEKDAKARAMADWRAQTFGLRPPVRPCHDVCDARGDAIAALLPPGDVLLTGGVPCVSRSLANKKYAGAERSAAGTESGLVREFARIRAELEAAGRRVHIVVENVPSHSESDKEYSRILDCEPVWLNSAAFGPQHRKRGFWCSFPVSPPRVWSDAVFADIAESAPDAKLYDFIYFPSVRRKPNAPFRMGVLPAPGVLKDLCGDKAANAPVGGAEQVCFDGGSKTAAITSDAQGRLKMTTGNGVRQGYKVSGDKTNPITGSGREELVLAASPAAPNRAYDHRAKAPAVLAVAGGRGEGLMGLMETREFRVGDKVLRLPVIPQGARTPTIGEIERLFSLRESGATAMPGASKTLRRRLLGGGWDMQTMAFVLRHLEGA